MNGVVPAAGASISASPMPMYKQSDIFVTKLLRVNIPLVLTDTDRTIPGTAILVKQFHNV